MLINLSNHPSADWDTLQTNEALRVYTKIIDVPFPQINPSWPENEVMLLAKEYLQKCMEILKSYPLQKNAVHLMGEFTFCFSLAGLLQKNGIVCITSTSERKVLQEGAKKIVEFNFVRFRAYPGIL